MTDTQIHDRLRDILREELGDTLRNQEVDRVVKHRIVEKVISSLLGAAHKEKQVVPAQKGALRV